MRLLPRERRQAMFAIYAFCREVDDIADGTLPAVQKRAQLGAWRDEIAAIFSGDRSSSGPRHVIARSLVGPVGAYGLRREDFLAVIDGVAMDADDLMRAPSAADLDLYADRVAGAVGRLSVRVFGCSTAHADQGAAALGRALQFTNILRDLAEDAERGRLYLPRELLLRHGIANHDPAAVLVHPNFPDACAEFARSARQAFADARAAMARCPRRPMRPAALMAAVYGTLLDRLEAAGWRPAGPRVRIPMPVKLWLVLRWGLF
ncbi:MAG: squalene synthase HpnD [Alphaproteobacteria bacterium]|nr:squalene synthase HpnD [Alphaproteobacteria bacterium]